MRINFTREHAIGLLIGVVSPLVFLPLVLLILSFTQNTSFEYLWQQVVQFPEYRSKYISLALISNLVWFYLFLNREKYNYSYGIILGMIVFVPYMIYANWIL
ncbi:MAG: hypothetical protein EBQ94_13165 [Flavobacteriales bacterium]|jgi:hypothetical protein|nr:hypothetical protein [Crocinitomicaceae bacterium]NBX81298.1 hypothetical protein [Flavobacteriales bacterium]